MMASAYFFWSRYLLPFSNAFCFAASGLEHAPTSRVTAVRQPRKALRMIMMCSLAVSTFDPSQYPPHFSGVGELRIEFQDVLQCCLRVDFLPVFEQREP